MSLSMSQPGMSQPPPLSSPAEIAALAETCLDLTADALRDSRAASEIDISHAINRVCQSDAEGIYLDLLQAVALQQGFHEEQIGPVVMGLAEKISEVLVPVPELIPFAGKLIIPSAFYGSFDQIYQAALCLLAPVIYVEDTDSIGVASVNPVAATILAPVIQEVVARRFGIRPFMTAVRMDYDSWVNATSKHFGV